MENLSLLKTEKIEHVLVDFLSKRDYNKILQELSQLVEDELIQELNKVLKEKDVKECLELLHCPDFCVKQMEANEILCMIPVVILTGGAKYYLPRTKLHLLINIYREEKNKAFEENALNFSSILSQQKLISAQKLNILTFIERTLIQYTEGGCTTTYMNSDDKNYFDKFTKQILEENNLL